VCTRVFDNRFDHVRVVGRTCDSEVSDEARPWRFPRGLERHGGCDGAAETRDPPWKGPRAVSH